MLSTKSHGLRFSNGRMCCVRGMRSLCTLLGTLAYILIQSAGRGSSEIIKSCRSGPSSLSNGVKCDLLCDFVLSVTPRIFPHNSL